MEIKETFKGPSKGRTVHSVSWWWVVSISTPLFLCVDTKHLYVFISVFFQALMEIIIYIYYIYFRCFI